MAERLGQGIHGGTEFQAPVTSRDRVACHVPGHEFSGNL